MMRGLAEFVMRGRWQALAVALTGSVLVVAAPFSMGCFMGFAAGADIGLG